MGNKKAGSSEERLSVFLSLVLRHQPEAAGITLDEHGWADVEALIQGISGTGRPMDMELLEDMVRTDEKGRYSFNEDRTLIRANQGHSIPVDVELTYQPPPISWASAPGSCLIRLMNIIWRIRRPEDPRSRCTVSEARWRTDSLHNNFSYKNNVLRKPNPVGFHSTYFIISGFRCPELPAVLHLIAYGKLSQSPAQFP